MSVNENAVSAEMNADGELPLRSYDEFSAAHIETPPSEESAFVSRRGFLGAVSATLALVGAEGCRRPLEKVVPYGKMPEEVIPGIPTHYATAITRRGDAVGLLVESHEGRPTKIEGNREHPASRGAADLIAQASVLDLYDPDRSHTARMHGAAPSSYAAFEAALKGRLSGHEKDQGEGLALLMPPMSSPTGLRLRDAISKRFPKARFTVFAPAGDTSAREGSKLAFGQAFNVRPNFARPRVVLSLDCDFMQTESGSTIASKEFAISRGRIPVDARRPPDGPMVRLYVVESTRTLTGSNADHRLRLPASKIEDYTIALAATLAKAGLEFGELGPVLAKHEAAAGIPEKWLRTLGKDLKGEAKDGGASLIVVGANQSPLVHALAAAMNAALGNVGRTLGYPAVTDPMDVDHVGHMRELSEAISKDQVKTLLIVGGNPVYDAPADLGFGELLKKVPFSAQLSLFDDETSQVATWHVARSHELEAWGDHRSQDGSVAIQQPLISPLFDTKSDLELLALVAGESRSIYDLVREGVRNAFFESQKVSACGPAEAGKYPCTDAAGVATARRVVEVEHDWKRALRAGVSVTALPGLAAPPPVRFPEIASAVEARKPAPAISEQNLEVTFRVDAKLFDGRNANNSWLQELPDPITKITWDNAAYFSPATAAKLGIANGDMVTLSRGQHGRPVTVGAWLLPGQPDNSIALSLGWGRTHAGRIGNARGFDVYPLRTSDAFWFATGVTVAKTGAHHKYAVTQEWNSQVDFQNKERPLARETTFAEFLKKRNFAQLQAPPPKKLPLWTDQPYSLWTDQSHQPSDEPQYKHQWGMSIDLNLCTGCSACVIACQSENNVPVVGPIEIARGREMSWIRLDRYYVENEQLGATAEDPLSVHQPVACVHCEEAPCENVCPVNATTHSPEGLNDMAYNRCIGTRYCANNCPYKVRRFNYLNWHNDAVWAATDGLPETLKMQQNPNVTVRFRGTMEKCSYCVQRIQSRKIAAKRELRELEGDEVQSACQQTCPSDAIVFGDLRNPRSQVNHKADDPRRYALLDELGTNPRTFYLGKVRNPNPEMA